jgi:hypothetical protein
MSYTAPEAGAFAKKKGSLSQKVCYELGLIDTEMESLGAGGEGASLADGKIWVGDGEGAAAAVTMSGDATLANTGAITIAAKAVEPAMMAVTENYIVVGQSGGAGAAKAMSGDATIASTGAITIAAKAVTPAKMGITDGSIVIGQDGGAGGEKAISGDATLANTGVLTISDSHMKRVKTALSSGAANAFCLAWQNPEDHAIIVTRLIVDLTTAGGTGTAELDFGPANDATTHADGLIDGVDANAIAIYDNIEDQGTNGQSVCKLDAAGGTTDYITGQILTEAANSLVGNAYIFYTAV